MTGIQSVLKKTLNTKTLTLNTKIDEINNTKTLNTNSVSVKKSSLVVKGIAEKLSIQLNNPTRFEYYCKVAWNLSENKIWTNLEIALKGRSPQKLFSYLCNLQMK